MELALVSIYLHPRITEEMKNMDPLNGLIHLKHVRNMRIRIIYLIKSFLKTLEWD